MLRRLLTILTLAACSTPAVGQFPGIDKFTPPGDEAIEYGDSRDKVSVSIKAASESVVPGSDLPVVVVLDIADRWHVWTNDRVLPEGMEAWDGAIRTELTFLTGEGAALVPQHGFITWPEPHGAEADVGDGPTNYGVFEGRAVIALPVTVSDDAPAGPATLRATITYQACDDKTCLAPVYQELELTVEIAPLGTAVAGAVSDPDFATFPPDVFGRIRGGAKAAQDITFNLFGLTFTVNAASSAGFILLLLVAAIGGFLLNLTPCVLPVIPLKIMSLSMSAGNRSKTLLLGVVMSLGIVSFWLALGVAIAVVSGFTATNQLFQYPAFTISVGVVIAIMSVGMCGLFSIRLPRFISSVSPKHDSLHGSFAFGVMTAVLSTPCTAPFMGAAAAWAATQVAGTVLTTFAAIGCGMASPYLVLAAFPRLVDRMPRTGPASELIKQIMGLLMLAAAAYFIGVGLSGLFATAPEPPSRTYLWAVAAFVAAAGIWMTWRTCRITRAPGNRLAVGALGGVFLLVAVLGGARFTDKGPINWVYYTPERFAQAQSDGKVVVMEFTAEWCLNCKALEESVLRSDRLVRKLGADDVVPIKVDLTGNNVDGNEMLGRVDRLTIPLLVVFKPDGTVVFKGDFYTVDQVVDAIEEAGGTHVARSGP